MTCEQEREVEQSETSLSPHRSATESGSAKHGRREATGFWRGRSRKGKQAMDKKKDVAIFGLWWSWNYGSIMTYYALYRTIKEMGYSVTMIDRPGFKPDAPIYHSHGRRFAKEHYEAITPVFGFREMRELNAYADTFVMGSDQVWNYGISRHYHGGLFFNFLDDDKRRLSYAASFGHPGFFAPEEEIAVTKGYLEKFDGISVREKDAVGVVNHTFGLQAVRVLDPVFLIHKKIYHELAEKSEAKRHPLVKGAYMAVYILDGNPEKKSAAQYLSEKLGLPMVVLLDGTMPKFDEHRKKVDLSPAAENLQVEDWLYYMENCSYLFTDSCHGASFAIIHEKPFVCVKNRDRGISRFESLGDVFGLCDRFVEDPLEVQRREELLEAPDYGRVNRILESERERSLKWLSETLKKPVLPVGEKGNVYVPPKRPVHDFAARCYRLLKRIYRKLF